MTWIIFLKSKTLIVKFLDPRTLPPLALALGLALDCDCVETVEACSLAGSGISTSGLSEEEEELLSPRGGATDLSLVLAGAFFSPL